MSTWDDLAGRALARQFPPADPGGPTAVVAVVEAIGPIQSQTARSPFLALAARLPGVDGAAIESAFDAHEIVKGSTLRGTVHTATASRHRVLDAVTRVGQRALWQRAIAPTGFSLEQLWSGIEEFAAADWRTVDELSNHLRVWVARREPARTELASTPFSRYLSFGHGGLLRKPLRGSWSGQGAAGYRSARAVLGTPPPPPEQAAAELVRHHLAAHGPASRNDLSWWSGLGLRAVDAALAAIGEELVGVTGPDGRWYHDLAGAPGPIELPGVRLLPEFDALMCAYEPSARARFVAPEHHGVLWNSANGTVLPPLLVDGRIAGYWRLSGAGRAKTLSVRWFARTRRPRRAEFDVPAAAISAALGVPISGLDVARH